MTGSPLDKPVVSVMQDAPPPISGRRKWIFRLFAVAMGVLFAEVTLSVMGMISPRVHYYLSPPWKRVTIPDDALGFRMSPFYPDNDRLGFRNQSVPDHCQLLAVGASMTYGFAATADKSWPRQLEGMIGKSVYNMSCGGYGPCQFEVLVKRGLELTPDVVVMEIYPANALAHAYNGVYLDGRLPELINPDAEEVAAFRRADQDFTLRQRWLELTSQPRSDDPSLIRKWLSERCALYALGRELKSNMTSDRYRSFLREDQLPQDSFEACARRRNRFSFLDERVRTVFLSPEAESQNLNLNDSRVREGLRITEEILQDLQHELRSRGIRFVILLIPSKLSVYQGLAGQGAVELPSSFFEAVTREQKVLDELVGFLRLEGIEYVNPLTALRSHLEGGAPLYPESDDQHLNGNGYKVLAAEVANVLAQPAG